MRIRAALLDLDGTLLDTAADLAAAANRMLGALGREPRSKAEIATYVGKGIPRLVERALTGSLDGRTDPLLMERALALFTRAYEEESGRHCRLYPGVIEGLELLSARGLRLACVTNKTERLTRPLLQQAGISRYFEVTVCGDTVARGKPDPLPLLYACERLGLPPGEAAMIGDSANDVIAARAAGMRVLCVPYGYREGGPVKSLGADAIVADVTEAARLLLVND